MSGYIDPTKETFAVFRANNRPGPIHMLNLVRLRERAANPDGRTATGAEAYAAYGRDSEPVFARLGGRVVWRGRFELMLIGPTDERWDLAFIAEYPSVAAFVEMIRDPVYREAVKHRQAAVEDSRLIRLAPGRRGSVSADFLPTFATSLRSARPFSSKLTDFASSARKPLRDCRT